MSNPTVHISQLQNISWLDGAACNYTLQSANHIWRINIEEHLTDVDGIQRLLSADEHERANRYYREKDKQRFIISRAYLRMLLAKYLDSDAKSMRFEIGQNKKPHVKGSRHLHYNVSHSGNYILIAISTAEVGVDVEFPDPNMNPDEIMPISYSKPEVEYVKTSDNQLQAFYIIWTRKEALLKATAKGIDDGLKFIPGIDGVHQTLYHIIGSEKDWIVHSFIVDEGYLGCIASAYNHHTFWSL